MAYILYVPAARNPSWDMTWYTDHFPHSTGTQPLWRGPALMGGGGCWPNLAVLNFGPSTKTRPPKIDTLWRRKADVFCMFSCLDDVRNGGFSTLCDYFYVLGLFTSRWELFSTICGLSRLWYIQHFAVICYILRYYLHFWSYFLEL